MNKLKIVSILLLLISTGSCAQNKKMRTEVDNIKELGKDSIIQLAMDITSFSFEKSNFDRITISANHEDVYVSFTNSVRYIPLYMGYLTDLHVSILSKAVSYNIIINPIDGISLASAQPNFYKPNEKVIQFVFDAINKSKEVGNSSDSNTKGSPEEINMTIKEKETYYDVLDASGTQESNYKVKKETGEIYDVVHFNLEIDPDAVDNEKIVDLTDYFIDQINTNACVTNDVLKSTYESIYDNIKNNSKPPVHDGEMGWTTSSYSSKDFGFSLIVYGNGSEFSEIISIYDKSNDFRCYLFKKKNESLSMYYKRHFDTQFFDEQKYKDVVAHFCEHIVNKHFKKSDLPVTITHQSLSKMDREALINLAKSKVNKHLEELNEEPFNYTGIDIKVLKNSRDFIVYFEQNFKYVPLHSAHYYGFEVFLLRDYGVGKLNRANGIDPAIEVNGNFDYYISSSQDLKKIAFVKKAISYKPEQNVIVNEKEKYYELLYRSSGIRVDKKTGELSNSWSRFYAPEEDPFIEIKLISKEEANTCPTQRDFKKGFGNLKKLVLKKGKKVIEDGDNYPNYIYKNFVYRDIPTKNNPMEIITVSGNTESGFYWIIKSNGKYQIDIKDYSTKIAKQKHKAALVHFCTHILKL